MEKKKNQEYAGQVADIVRSDIRLSFVDVIKPVTEEIDVPYLNIFTPDSVYLAKLFRYKNRASLTANIPLRDMPMIKMRTRLAEEEIFKVSNGMPRGGKPEEPAAPARQPETAGPGSQEKGSKAFSVKFRFGKLAGKSPGELLLADPSEKTVSLLNNEIGFLSGNLEKFPKNREIIDAIREAVALNERGLLTEKGAGQDAQAGPVSAPAPDSAVFDIYVTPTKYFKHNVRNGKNLCYSLRITCAPGRNYPYQVEVMNCYAPIGMYKNGMRPVMMNQAEDVTRDSIGLSESEWLYTLDALDSNAANVRQAWYAYCRKNDSENKTAWRNAG